MHSIFCGKSYSIYNLHNEVDIHNINLDKINRQQLRMNKGKLILMSGDIMSQKTKTIMTFPHPEELWALAKIESQARENFNK